MVNKCDIVNNIHVPGNAFIEIHIEHVQLEQIST